MNNDESLRYPIGKFSPKESYSADDISSLISTIEALPSKVEVLVKNFTAKQLDTNYREGGWTARQVIHHLSDSHMNAYIRLKWTLTENTPLIKAYDEGAWAETPEVNLDPSISLNLLNALHVKWVSLLKLLTEKDMEKQFLHPETKKYISLERMIATYAWHGEHHLSHLEIVSKK
ncbi:YfiT family bacillithiol transferase [Chryseosolibacter indicus]|uniref:Metal-dependent hydrolase n=1 Tax=Chryseosolibacter indicus TaxID=2782351 RepID=A0ABS5VV02_9BACT|nr:putative metal-dependent hydrolase [Chryseosolibacter indicus]MBT1705258.1 putative metal-dependent hydrolase [Chryseosolibacter indicus]